MIDGEEGSTSRELTVDSAANVLAKMLSPQEKTAPPRESQEPEKPAPAAKAEVADPPAPDPADTEHESVDDGTDDKPDEGGEEPEMHVVKVDGSEYSVTLDELKSGYGFRKHNTQQAQAIAEDRKKLLEAQQASNSDAEAARVERQRVATTLAELERIVAAQEPPEPDWDKLRRDDPDSYRDTRDQWDIYKERKAKLASERVEAEKQVAADYEKQFGEHLKAQQEALFEKLPDWREPEKRNAEMQKMAQFAVEKIGFSPADIQGVTDHRTLLLLRKAYLYDESQKAKPTIENKIEKPIATGKPGTRGGARPNPIAESRKRLANDGSVDAAADFLGRLLAAQATK